MACILRQWPKEPVNERAVFLSEQQRRRTRSAIKLAFRLAYRRTRRIPHFPMSRIVLYSTYESWEGIQLRLGMFEEATVEYICTSFADLSTRGGLSRWLRNLPYYFNSAAPKYYYKRRGRTKWVDRWLFVGAAFRMFPKSMRREYIMDIFYIKLDGHVRVVRASLWRVETNAGVKGNRRDGKVIECCSSCSWASSLGPGMSCPFDRLAVNYVLLYRNLLDPHSADG